MEQSIDQFLEALFGETNIQIANIMFGILLVITGFALLGAKLSKAKKIGGWIFLVLGCLGLLSGTIQILFLKLF